MSNSILTNNEAASALMRMAQTNKSLSMTQERISSGQKVAGAKDNASTFAIATGMRSDVAVFRTIKESLSLGEAVINSSLSAAEQVASQIKSIMQKIAQAADQPSGRALIQQDIDNAVAQIKSFVASATFNGINLIDGTGKSSGQQFKVTAAIDRDALGVGQLTQFAFDYQDLSVNDSEAGLGSLKNLNVNRQTPFDNDPSAKTTIVTEITAPLEDGETMTFSYIDASGNTRTLTHTNNTGADYADGDATWTAFLADHEDTLDSLGFTVSGTGDTRTVARANGSRNTFGGVSGTGAFDQETAKTITMDFNGKPLQLDDEMKISYAVGGTTRTVVLRVSDSASGAGLGTDDDGNEVISLDVDEVGGSGATPQQVAAAVRTALEASADFATAGPTAGTIIGVGAAGADGTLVLTTDAAGATDDLTGVTIETDFTTLMAKADAAETVLKNALGALGSAAARLVSQQEYVDSIIKSVDANIGTLVDADMAEEAARLQALQAKQQLGLQALSIANAQPQALLRLFQG